MMRWAFYNPATGPAARQQAAPGRALCKNRGMPKTSLIVVLLLFCAASHNALADGKLYKWVDENGVVHYGDHVPAKHAKARTEVLNAQGVTINVIEAEKTAEDLAEEIRLRGLEEERLAAEAARRAYDRALLDSYESVDDIMATRKRRLDAVDGQIVFTTHHISQIKNRIASIEAEIERVVGNRKNKDGSARRPPKRLVDELATARSSLAEHAENLESHYLDQARIRIKYAEDIERFKVLRGLAEEKVADSPVSGSG